MNKYYAEAPKSYVPERQPADPVFGERNDLRDLPSNVELIRKPGFDLRIVYENHLVNTLGKKAVNELYGSTDGLFVEDLLGYSPSPESKNQAMTPSRVKAAGINCSVIEFNNSFLPDAQKYVVENNIPILHPDIMTTSKEMSAQIWASLTQRMTRDAVGGVAFAVAAGALLNAVKDSYMSRREMILTVGGGLTATALYGNTIEGIVLAGNTAMHLGGDFQIGERAREILKNSSPEDLCSMLVLSLRNYIWAEKIDYYSKLNQRPNGEKLELSMIAGAMHFGLSDAVKESSAKRLQIIEKLLIRLKNSDINFDHKTSISMIAKSHLEDMVWVGEDPIIDPQLQSIYDRLLQS